MLALAMIMLGGMNVMALETYDFQELCMKLGKGGPWAVNDGGDAGFTLGTDEAPVVMHFLGDYTDQGFTWNQRFAYEYVDGRNKFTMRNKNDKKDSNCGMFSWDYTHYFSILDLKDGDKVTITIGTGTVTFANEAAEGTTEGDNVVSKQTYTISTTEESTRLDIQMAKATLIAKIEIEPYGVETVPVISVTPKSLKLIPGATAKLSASVSPSMATVWSSSDESVATIESDGTVTAVAAGTATITNSWKSEVSDATAEDACVITVADVDLSSFTIVKSYDFTTMGDVTLEIQSDAAGAIWNEANSKNNNVFFCLNEGLENIAVQAVVSSNKGWSIVDGQGLFLASGAGRCAAVAGIKAGQIVEFIYTGTGFYTRSEDDGIEKTALNEATGRAIYQAVEDGMIGFELDKGNYVKQINIYESNSVTTTKTIGLVPGVWTADNAIFAAYAWNDEGNAWFPFVEVSGAYATQIPDNYTGILLARINPEGTDTDPWKNVWNQTGDIDFTTVADQTVFTITGWDGGDGKSTYTTSTVPADLSDLKATLAKVIELAKIFGYDTAEAEALLVNDEATAEQLVAALQTLAANAKDKASEALALAKAFFNQFDATAAEALATFFDAAETALAGDDVDAMLAAAKALATNALVEGQSAIEKVDSYLRKMNNETVNTDLNNIQAALASDDLQSLVAAIKQLKDHISDAATAYVAGVSDLISEGAAAGKDVTAMQAAYTNFLTVALKYKTEKATVVELGYALYTLIKAVEDYKQATTTGINVVTTADQNAVIYNVKGQRVMNAQKGLFIINGMKVIK